MPIRRFKFGLPIAYLVATAALVSLSMFAFSSPKLTSNANIPIPRHLFLMQSVFKYKQYAKNEKKRDDGLTTMKAYCEIGYMGCMIRILVLGTVFFLNLVSISYC